MTFSAEITIDGVLYTLVDIQRDKITAIYKNADTFLRIGDVQKIQKDLDKHKGMVEAGFPIAEVFSEGAYEDAYFFVEDSMGERCYAEIFRDEVDARGVIQPDTFNSFLNLSEQFMRAQLTTRIPDVRWLEFRDGIKLDWLIDELPELKDKLESRFEKLKKHIAPYPFVLTHGDLTPFNMFPKGVIDLEDSFFAPIGFDLVGITEHLNWVPVEKTYEFFQWYHYTDVQRSATLALFDRILIEFRMCPLTSVIQDFDFAKGIWFAVRMHDTPLGQQFRYDRIRETL